MENNFDSRLNKERALGALIAKSLRKHSDMEGCPSTEDIAALVDRKLKGKEKEKIMAHITSCQDCYEIFSETSKSVLLLSKSRRDKITWFSIPAVALAACLLLVLRVVFYSPERNMPYTHDMIGQLASILETSNLESEITARGKDFSGLAGSLGLLTPQQQDAFRIGFYLAGLELTAANKKLEQANEQLSALGKIMKWGEGTTLAENFKQIEEFLIKGKFPEASEEIHSMQSALESETKSEKSNGFYHLGLWCSIGQMVLKSGNREAIKIFLSDTAPLQSMTRLLEKQDAPKDVLEDLGKIMVFTKSDILGDKDYQDMSNNIKRIVDYFLI